jgi:hypothetical protein
MRNTVRVHVRRCLRANSDNPFIFTVARLVARMQSALPMRVRPATSSAVVALAGLLVGVFAVMTAWAGLHGRLAYSASPSAVTLAKEPSAYLWAWERPEDLRFLDQDDDVGVAFLAETIEIAPQSTTKDGSGIVLRQRRQPLKVNNGTPLMAVIRIESSNDLWRPRPGVINSTNSQLYTAEQRKRIVELISTMATLPRVSAIQIDFDAAESEQPFYAALLADVRSILPREMPLSITALASWCIGDPWIDRLPPGTIDEAVPMLFRMGPNAANVASFVQSGKEFGPRACRKSVGVSTDERFSHDLLRGAVLPVSFAAGLKRTYIFSDRAWTADQFREAIAEVEK